MWRRTLMWKFDFWQTFEMWLAKVNELSSMTSKFSSLVWLQFCCRTSWCQRADWWKWSSAYCWIWWLFVYWNNNSFYMVKVRWLFTRRPIVVCVCGGRCCTRIWYRISQQHFAGFTLPAITHFYYCCCCCCCMWRHSSYIAISVEIH